MEEWLSRPEHLQCCREHRVWAWCIHFTVMEDWQLVEEFSLGWLSRLMTNSNAKFLHTFTCFNLSFVVKTPSNDCILQMGSEKGFKALVIKEMVNYIYHRLENIHKIFQNRHVWLIRKNVYIPKLLKIHLLLPCQLSGRYLKVNIQWPINTWTHNTLHFQTLCIH